MSWIYVGLLAGSLVTSTHDSKEACEGRGVTLKEKGVIGKCVEQSNTNQILYGSGISGGQMLCAKGDGTLGKC